MPKRNNIKTVMDMNSNNDILLEQQSPSVRKYTHLKVFNPVKVINDWNKTKHFQKLLTSSTTVVKLAY